MAADPLVWILSGGRKGDLDQMLVLARATGWRFEVKQAGSGLAAPWPDLLLCAEASASRTALRIKRKSHGRTRAVCLGRPAGATRSFDLVITTAQYRIPAASNVVEIAMPLATPERHPGPAAPDGPVTLLVGGPAFPDLLDRATAARLAEDALALAARRDRLLSVQTSPRTPRDAIGIFEAAIRPPHRLGIFGRGENRYAETLAEASEIVVTSDSISMLSDALASGRPVSVYPLPQALNLKWRAGEWLHRHAVEAPSPLFTPVRWLFDAGLVEAAADRRRLHARLVAEKRLVWFGAEPLPPQQGAGARDLETAVQSLRALMSGPAYHG
jgi:mitochondrial fission protein ELM1